MTVDVTLGVDIGTSSSKGVLVDSVGAVVASTVVEHQVARPQPGWVEMSGGVWWDEFVRITRTLLDMVDVRVTAVGVSGMGPCLLLADTAGRPVRPAILYGIDTRATKEIAALSDELGDDLIRQRCGSSLTTQAVGPKIEWVRRHEPTIMSDARRLFMPSSWLVYRLTGAYVLDLHSASQCTPLLDSTTLQWFEPWSQRVAHDLELPELLWPGQQAGTISADAASITGLPEGTPVIAGTIDAWAEAVSVGAHDVGDLMLMYGTTMFLICTVADSLSSPSMWGTVGAFPGTHNLAGGMATSGAITSWLNQLCGDPGYATLVKEAEASGPGARGLVMLPYFAGERTPIQDPHARGAILGLTIAHQRGDLYRAALEATAFGVRHNVEVMVAAGADIDRVVAVGGGITNRLWPQIVSDVTGLPQVIPTHTVGAAYGGAFLAAASNGDVDIADWNPPRATLRPNADLIPGYDETYVLYRQLYECSADIAHRLAQRTA